MQIIKHSKKFLILSLIILLVSSLFAILVIAQRIIGSQETKLYPGLNLLSVTPPMIGKTLADLNSGQSCTDFITAQSAFMYDNENKEWLAVQNLGRTLPDFVVDIDTFQPEHVGMGLWVKVQQDCILGCGLSGCADSVSSGSQEITLSSYPYPFVKDGRMNSIIVVGLNDPSGAVIGAADIGTSLQYEAIGRLEVGSIKLASEVEDIKAQNVIVIGHPCSNSAAAELLGNPINCAEGYEGGKGTIRLFKHSNGNVALLVSGYSGMDQRRVASVLADHKSYSNLKGMAVEVTGTFPNNINVNPLSS